MSDARSLLSFVTLAAALSVTACATGQTGTPDDDGGTVAPPPDQDGGPSDGGSPDHSAGCPTGRAGPSCQQCANGFHACGASCSQPYPNVPDAGCANGCGGACPVPTHGAPLCTTSGGCDFTCDPTFTKTGGAGDGGAEGGAAGSCDCGPGLKECASACEACCAGSDCAPHTLCSNGTCGGCEPGYADCNNNPADGCEARLNAEPNCGSCGTSCCGSFCGCGFLGVGGKSCKPSGTSYSCQC